MIISDTTVRDLATVLMHAMWQAALAAALLRAWLWLGPTARGRHTAACLALASLPLMAALTFLRVHAFDSAAPLAGNLADPEAARFWQAGLDAAVDPTTVAGSSWLAWPSWLGWPAWPAWTDRAIVAAWAAGALLLSLRQLFAGAWLRRRVLADAQPLPASWQRRAETLATRLGVRVRFVTLAMARVPFTFGWLRAIVVMPPALFSAMPPAELELLLLHELSHLTRRDYLVHALQSLVESVFFFHPAVWWMGRVARRERELACDEQVVAFGADRQAYARALANLETLRQPEPALAANGGELLHRLRAILDEPRVRRRVPRTLIAAGTALIAALAALACSGDDDGALVAGTTPPSVALPPEASPADTDTDTGTSSAAIAWLPANVRRHANLIDEAAAAHAVDAQLVALMVLVESGGDAGAVSPLGARGLMQLMPPTARRVAGRHVDDAELDDPRVNLALGTQLLRDLLAERDLELALASYNAGRAAVRDHLERGTPLPDETQRYTRLLLELYDERNEPRSAAYEAWRARVHAHWQRRAKPPLASGATVTSPFGQRSHPVDAAEGAPQHHTGIDLAAREGDPVHALLDGTVEEAGSDDLRGVYLVIRHNHALLSRYHHLGATRVRQGDRVAAGEPIGSVGNTGVSTGPHLHLEVLDQGEPIDPTRLLQR